jgi:hypothetical protein
VIDVEDEDSGMRSRVARDTAVDDPLPTALAVGDKRNTPSLGAATLPPVARPASRPPSRAAIQAPAVVTRPASEEARSRRDSDVVEVYAPAPPSVDAPPGARGSYSVNRVKDAPDVPMREQTGRIQSAIPAGLGRPRLPSTRTPTAGAPTTPDTGQRRAMDRTQPDPPPPPRTPQPPVRPETQPARARTPTPARIPQIGQQIGGRPPTPGVVMSRPAVIVGAPAKPVTTGAQRVRKASEDAGRGFGQGLISEKSLDEVILAYLSEDAEDK